VAVSGLGPRTPGPRTRRRQPMLCLSMFASLLLYIVI
jgi:hypothetical protein